MQAPLQACTLLGHTVTLPSVCLACSLARQTRSDVSSAASAATRSVALTSSASCAHSACAALRLLRKAVASLHPRGRRWMQAH